MWNISESDQVLVRYLLGELEPRDRDQLEDRYFADDELHAQLLAVEEELVDSYVHDELSPEQRKHFEEWFLASPERRAKVKFAESLAAYKPSQLGTEISSPKFVQLSSPRAERPVWASQQAALAPPVDGEPSKRSEVWEERSFGSQHYSNWKFWQGWKLQLQLAVAAAVLAVVLIPVTLRRTSRAPGTQVAYNSAPSNRSQTPVLSGEPPQNGTASQTKTGSAQTPPADYRSIEPRVLAFALSPVVRSSSEGNTFQIPSGLHTVRLDLNLGSNDYTEYRVTVEKLGTGMILEQEGLKPHLENGKSVITPSFSSVELPSGDYAVRIFGKTKDIESETLNGYAFRVIPGQEPVRRQADVPASVQPETPSLREQEIASARKAEYGLRGLVVTASGLNKNGELAQFCRAISPVMMKYPFNSSSDSDSALIDIAKVFAPTEGLVWKYVQQSASDLVVRTGQEWQPNPTLQGMKVAPELLAFLNRAQQLTGVLFAESGMMQPKLKYVLRPVPRESITIRATLDGDEFNSRNPIQKTLYWPAPAGAKPGADGTVEAGGFTTGFGRFDGTWGVFRLFQNADERPYGTRVVQWSETRGLGGAGTQKLNPPARVELVEFPGGVDLFNPKFFEALKCPTVAVFVN